MLTRISIYFSAVVLLVLIVTQPLSADAPDPVRGKQGMVVSASELASKVGLNILKRGGNAVDAAVATGFALAVTYPAAGNIGGGGFMVIHLKDGRDITIDYREKAPLSATRDMFLDEEGNFRIDWSAEGITASGVPGSVDGLIYALEKYGTMKLEDVIQPAINLALDGFPLEYRAARSLESVMDEFKKYPSSYKVFSKNGKPYEEGEIFKQTDLGKTLMRIKENGRDGFYAGETADLFIKQVKEMGGHITHEDLKRYKAAEREPVRGTYRGYDIISMPPPSSGGIAIIELLNALENFEFKRDDWGSSGHIHKIVEAMKHVYADRTIHLGDEDFYDVPKEWLISKERGKEIWAAIKDTATASEYISEGKPSDISESMETTHYSVYDKEGNAVSVTTTINSSYGSKIVVEGAGFLLNNEMDDFSAKPGEPNQFGLLGSEANAIEPEKRMLSSMTPTIVLKDGKPYLIAGSPGGSTIITVVLQVVMNVLDFGMDVQEAVNAARIHHQWYPDEINYERYGIPTDVLDNLKKMGHKFGGLRTLGRADCILIKDGVIYGATDPRGYGSAEGY